MFTRFTPDQLARRKASVWTPVVMWLAGIQFLAYIIGFYLVIRYLAVGEGYLAASISVWIKIILMWAITVTGMLCEKDIFDTYFMAGEFFWEDVGNLVAMITHNAYFVVLWIGFEPRSIMFVMLFAYVTYLLNLCQWLIVGVKSYRQRNTAQAATPDCS